MDEERGEESDRPLLSLTSLEREREREIPGYESILGGVIK